jgi:signal transduction histidine kinase
VWLLTPRAALTDDDFAIKAKIMEVLFAIGCGYLIHTTNEQLLLDMKKLRDGAVEANQSKLTFIAKMRFALLCPLWFKRWLICCSHDLRTPLVGLFGFCDMLSSTALTPKQSEHLNIIYFSADLLNHLIENVLDFSRLVYLRFHSLRSDWR